MNHKIEEIKKAADLAEKVAGIELRLGESRKSKTSTPTINKLRTDLNRGISEFLGDLLAEQLLPQARTAVRAEHKRLSAIKKSTILGRLRCMIEVLMREPPKTGKQEVDEVQAFYTKHDNTAWDNFCEALDQGDRITILESLAKLLQSAMINLAWTELPPSPPPYEIPEEEEV